MRRWFILQLALVALGLALAIFKPWQQPVPQPVVAAPSTLAEIRPLQALDNGRWTRSFRGADGTIYLRGRLQSRDGGQTVQPQTGADIEAITASPERAVLARPGLFYALDGPAELVSPGVYQVRGWRSTDGLRTLATESVRLEIPDGPTRPRQEGEWFGLYVYRTLLTMPDGSWLLTMYGNFADDTLLPPDRSSQHEVKYMMRSFVLRSEDEGRSWQYLATVAAPRPGDPIGEGFVEPAITLLPDGWLLCILRTGHHYPLYASWSSDGGRSWSAPLYTGLDRGCDPCLITLADGRVALSWGRRYPEGWSQLDAQGDVDRFVYPGAGVLNLSLSSDGGRSWRTQPLGRGLGSCYSTLIEVEPDVLFLQVDQWIGRVTLRPAEVKATDERPADQ